MRQTVQVALVQRRDELGVGLADQIVGQGVGLRLDLLGGLGIARGLAHVLRQRLESLRGLVRGLGLRFQQIVENGVLSEERHGHTFSAVPNRHGFWSVPIIPGQC